MSALSWWREFRAERKRRTRARFRAEVQRIVDKILAEMEAGQ